MQHVWDNINSLRGLSPNQRKDFLLKERQKKEQDEKEKERISEEVSAGGKGKENEKPRLGEEGGEQEDIVQLQQESFVTASKLGQGTGQVRKNEASVVDSGAEKQESEKLEELFRKLEFNLEDDGSSLTGGMVEKGKRGRQRQAMELYKTIMRSEVRATGLDLGSIKKLN